MGAVTPSRAISQAHFRGLGAMIGRDAVQHFEQRQAALVQVLADFLAAFALAQVGLAAVLARQKPRRQAVVGDHADSVGDAGLAQRAIEAGAVVQVVLRLQHLIGGQALFLGYLQRFLQLRGVQIGRAHRANLAGLDRGVISTQGFGIGRLRIGPVGEIQVDMIGAQACQRSVERLGNIGTGQALVALAHVGTDLGEDRHLLTCTRARLEPAADNGLGLAALVAIGPGRVDVGGVDGVEAMIDEGIEHGEAGLFIDGPAKHIAAEHQRDDIDTGIAKWTLVHFALLERGMETRRYES